MHLSTWSSSPSSPHRPATLAGGCCNIKLWEHQPVHSLPMYIWSSFQSGDTTLAREQSCWLCLGERKGVMVSENNKKRGLQALLPGNPAYPPSQSWLTLSYVRPEGKYSPTTPPSPGRKVSSRGRRQGKPLWPPQQERSTKL